jgi:hypothetical protein
MKRKIICALVWVCCISCFSLTYSFSLQDKALLENSLQEQVKQIGEKILGHRNFVVLVNIEISTEALTSLSSSPSPAAAKPATAPSPSTRIPRFIGLESEEIEVLPGVKIRIPKSREESVPAQPATVQENPTIIPFTQIIKRIVVSIIVDRSVDPVLLNTLKKQLPGLLGLNTERDIVEIKPTQFYKKSFQEQFLEFLYPNIHWLLLILLLFTFLFGPLRHFFKTVVKAMELRIEADTRIRGMEKMELGGAGGGPGGAVGLPAGPLEITFERKRRAELPEKGGEMGKHFSFINENNLKNLIYLLKEETVQTIAIVISYLPPEFSSQVISSLDPETQARVAVELATVKLKSPEQVAEVEKRIKEKIDYIIGGEDYFLNLLDQVDPKTQENILYKLEQQNPELAAKLRRVVFTFQDIVILEKPALQRVIREAQREGVVLAIALKNASEEIKSAVMDVLSEGARAMLTEQMDLIGEIGEKRIEEEQKKIVRIVRALEKSGDIVVDHDKILSRISQTKVIEAVPEKEFTETTANNENENQSKFGYGFGSEAQTPYKEENTDTVKFSSSDTNYGYTDEGTFKIK